MIGLWLFLNVVGVVLLVVLIRTFRFVPGVEAPVEEAHETLDDQRVIESLQKMIQFKTISYKDKTLEDTQAFKAFLTYLKTRYPLIQEAAQTKEVQDTGIYFKIKGLKHDRPVVLMSHYDVVPENGTWNHDPFSGKLIEGTIYGRGTLDTKATLACVMESVEQLLKEDYTFKQDLYLCFSGDEETRGPSAANIVSELNKAGVKPALVLDEGGAVVSDVFPGVKKQAAMIGVAEKGYINMRVSATSPGGHAAMPPVNSPVTELAEAITRLNKGNVFKLKRTEATQMMFDHVARHSLSFGIRMIFANLWLFWPLVKLLAKKSGGELKSLLHTTQAFTMMEGSNAMNVLPSEASIGINYRILTGETVQSVHEKMKHRMANPKLLTEFKYRAEPTSISRTDGSYEQLKSAIHKTWGDVVTVPYLMMAGTDSRYYHAISDHVYRFSPMMMSKAERETIHSTEEAIRVEQLLKCARFYVTLLKTVC